MRYPFQFEFRRTAQAVGHLLRREDCGKMNYMRLLKLLYIADRESIRAKGEPITGATVCAMPRGPVLSEVLNLIKDTHVDAPAWSKFFSRHNYVIQVTGHHPGVDALSPHDIEILDGVSEKYETFDEWDMVNETHQFEEWSRNNPGTSSKQIPLEHILQAIGQSENLDAIADSAAADASVDRLFGPSS